MFKLVHAPSRRERGAGWNWGVPIARCTLRRVAITPPPPPSPLPPSASCRSVRRSIIARLPCGPSRRCLCPPRDPARPWRPLPSARSCDARQGHFRAGRPRHIAPHGYHAPRMHGPRRALLTRSHAVLWEASKLGRSMCAHRTTTERRMSGTDRLAEPLLGLQGRAIPPAAVKWRDRVGRKPGCPSTQWILLLLAAPARAVGWTTRHR